MRILLIITILIFALNLTANIINIPMDYQTIQEGINASTDNDTVLVEPGTYYENINYNGKNITVASNYIINQNSSFIYSTIINGSQPSNPDSASVVMFCNEEDSTAVLIGFTITEGSGSFGVNFDNLGGGICVVNSSPSLKYLYIFNNHAEHGAGLGFNTSNSKLIGLVITRNTTSGFPGFGGGIFNHYSNLIISGSSIYNNSALYGGGFYIGGSLEFSVENRCNIYSNNTSNRGSGADLYSGYSVIDVIVDTFTVLNPTEYHAYKLSKFNFDIQNCVHQQVDADLYVSSEMVITAIMD